MRVISFGLSAAFARASEQAERIATLGAHEHVSDTGFLFAVLFVGQMNIVFHREI